MKTLKQLAITFAAISMSVLSFGQSQDKEFYVDVQMRNRGEVRAGTLEVAPANDDATAFMNERVRISMGYKQDNLSLKVSGQHTGVWGQTAQNPVNYGDFNLNEAWARYDFSKVSYLQFGRQALVYDDERLLGGLDWHVSGRFHDAAKLALGSANKAHQLHLIGSWSQNSPKTSGGTYFATGGQAYKYMTTLWYHYGKPATPFGASVLVMNLGFENGTSTAPSARNLLTAGTYLTWAKDGLKAELSYYHQGGKTAENKTINADMVALKASYRFCPTFNLSAGCDVLSGQKEGEKYNAFNPLYGTHHKFYGLQDYWYINLASPANGLADPYVSADFTFSKKVSLTSAFHAFLAQSTYGGVESGDYRASEVDLQLTWKTAPNFTVMGGCSAFMGGKNFNGSESHKNQGWFWLQLNVNPRVFFAK